MGGYVGQRTVGYQANRKSGETFLLLDVHRGRNLWGVGVTRPRCFQRLRHGLGVRGSRIDEVEWGEEGERGKQKELRSSMKGSGGVQRVINVQA